ncbi:MAG: radical SAM family heme chaperone HemW [Parasporobacterium sp.]|nr:radical SAM family heme chaperone HemW [Parasporobacterium sp.]
MLLYIHIPFCVKKCDYCDFLSFSCGDEKIRDNYLRAVIRQLDYYSENSSKFKHISSIFIGGGTPSSLSEDELEKLLSNIAEIVSEAGNDLDNIEFTIECNPGTLNESKLDIMRKYGVNRLSLGLQSAKNEELNCLGRIHTFEDFVNSFNMARTAGFSNINVDLMSALPGQTLDSWKSTLEEVVALDPEHISAYSLIIEEGTPFYELYGEDAGSEADLKAEDRLPDEDTEREIYHFTKEFLAEHGYNRYEISNYSRPGFECKHNCGYWTRENYAGIGLGAASLMGDRRYNNTDDLDEYINSYTKNEPGIYAVGIERLSDSDKMGEFMFLGLRLMEGVSAAAFKKAFGRDVFKTYAKAIETSVEEGLMLISDDGDNIRLTERGIDVSNIVFARFI